MKQMTNLKELKIAINQDKKIEEKIFKSEEDYYNGRIRKAEDVFNEWKIKYGI